MPSFARPAARSLLAWTPNPTLILPLVIVLTTALITAIAPLPAAAAPPADLGSRAGEDWATFLGPGGNGRSGLTGLAVPWPADGPAIVWQCELGDGYCAPAVALGRALVYDRVGQNLRLRCLHAETGRPIWEALQPTDYTDTFGYDGGPRSAPVIHDDRVLTFAPDGRLECRSLTDGGLRWQVDTSAEYHVVQNFFGVGAAPLVFASQRGAIAIVPVGGSPRDSAPPAPDRLDLVKGADSGLVAFDLATGRERWRSSDQLASYSSPQVARIGGQDRVLAWMRDRFLVVEPESGAVRGGFRWRAEELFSVVAANPVVWGDEVLLSETYGPGSVLLDLGQGDPRVVRQDRPDSRPDQALKAHWATPVLHEGHLYASSGRNSGDAVLCCVEWRTGKVRWAEGGFGRSSLALADGHLIVLGEFGDLALVEANPDRYAEVSRARLTRPSGRPLLAPPCWAAPVIARGCCYVRGQGRLVCLDLLAPR